MSIELKQAAEKALVVLVSATSFMSRKARDQHESVVAELRTAIQQAEAQQPATSEPVKATPYNPTEEMRLAMKRIDPALSSEQCRALWSAAWSAAPTAHPAPSVPSLIEKAISSGWFGVLPVKATTPMCKAGCGAKGSREVV